MPIGDAGLEWQTADAEYQTICGWVTKYGWLNAAMAERVRQLLHRQQAVVDAARRWREPAPDCPAPWSSALHFEHDCRTARSHQLMGAVDEYNATQATQPEGERA